MKIKDILKERINRKKHNLSLIDKISLKEINYKLEQIEKYGDDFPEKKKELLKQKAKIIK